MSGAKSPVGIAWRVALVGICLVPYVASYTMPALHFHLLKGEERIMKGSELAMMGPLALLHFNVAWLANLLFLQGLALMLGGLWRSAAVFAALAALFGLHTLQFYTQTIDASLNMGRDSPMLLTQLEPGFYLWMGSFGLVLIVSLACWLRDRKIRT